MKIHELAREIGVDSKDIVDFLKKEGVEVKSYMSAVPEDMFVKIKSNFSGSEKKTSGIKAVALPDYLLKQVEEEKAQKEKLQAEKKAAPAQKEEEKPSENPAKKKKVHVKINTQNSAQLKAKQQQSQRNAPAREEAEKKPVQKKWVSAKDRIPDDVRQEREKKAAKEAAEKAAREEAQRIAAEKAAAEAAAEEAAKEEAQRIAAEKAAAEAAAEAAQKAAEEEAQKASKATEEEALKTSEKKAPAKETAKEETAAGQKTGSAAEEKPAANAPQKSDAKAKENAKQPQKQPARNDSKKNPRPKQKVESVSKIAEEKKPKVLGRVEPVKESQAARSLREKLVKGQVNKEDLLGASKKTGDKTGQKRPSNQKGQYSRNSQNGQAGQSRDRNSQGASKNQYGSNNKDRSSGSAPVMDSSKGARKGQKGSKDRYEKNKGDKFDRLENEKAAMKNSGKQKAVQKEEEIKVITIPDTISIKDFAEKLRMKPADLIKKLFLAGKVYTVNDILEFEAAEEIALEMDIICEKEEVVDYIAELLKEEDDPEETLVKRPPVVCVMGHVDHGKTSLLDAIRKTNVIAGEAGGITQHIGAYTVEINDEKITFLDTPGHEAFTAMRLRGAMATDVAILVVAADDGVMPQTIEAINHARAANIHVIVAINKIDKPGANIDKVKQELSDQGVVPEEWGGDTIFVPVSAKKHEGIENLLEMVILDTEILELRANPDRMARGIVIEAKIDKGRGSVATLLVQKGTLKVGDHVAMGESYGKVRAMINDKGQRIKEAGPSTPVEITGLNGVPNAGDTFVAYKTDKEAKQFAQVFIEENKKKLLAGTKAKMSLDDVFNQMKAGELKELDIIVKADVAGSVEAIRDSLEKLTNDEVVVRCIHTGVGNVSESDAILASASNAIIIAFNVGVNADARSTVEHEKVDLRSYSVIYDAIDDVELAMKGMLEPVFEESVIGHIEVRQIFKASGIGVIAGSYVTDGIVKRSAKIRLSRDGQQLYEGEVASLKRFNDDAKEVRSGFECGIVLKDFSDIKEGDIMEAYEMKEVSRV